MNLSIKIEDYKKKYNDALERARYLMTNQNCSALDKHLIKTIFTERKDANYECSYEQAKDEVEYILKRLICLMMNWKPIISDLLCCVLIRLIKSFFGFVHCQKSVSIYMNSVDIRNVGNGYIGYFGKVNMN